MRYKWALGLVINKVKIALSDTTARPISVDDAQYKQENNLE
jgi:hypothetical protein